MKKKDNTFKAIGLMLAIVLPIAFVFMKIQERNGFSLSDILLCIFTGAALETLCFLAHHSINK